MELENLPLKKDALKSLDIPIEVKSGNAQDLHVNMNQMAKTHLCFAV